MSDHSQFYVYESFDESIPLLFQYTTEQSFQDILDSNALWFTHIQFQNDAKEFSHALDIMQQLVEEEYEGLTRDIRTFLNFVSPEAGVYPVFICSLTNNSDILSQWRAYSPNSGCSYAIKPMQLGALMAKNKLILAKCIYEEKEQRDFIKKYIIGVSPEDYKKAQEPGNEGNAFSWSSPNHIAWFRLIATKMINYAPVIKHPAFAEESEWRLIRYNDYSNQYIRPGVFNIPSPRRDQVLLRGINNNIPYIAFSLVNGSFDKVYFEKIIRSPEASEVLIDKTNQLVQSGQAAEVCDSKIPYRTSTTFLN